MSVYTELNQFDMDAILSGYNLGVLNGFSGIAAGVENSNYFVDTDQGRYVLTIFERMDSDDLPYFMRLMRHLSGHGFPCPAVQTRHDDSLLFDFRGKKGCIVTCIPGCTLNDLDCRQLQSAGHMLGKLHLKGLDFPEDRSNPTFFKWIYETGQSLLNQVGENYGNSVALLLEDEMAWQQQAVPDSLPSGLIHADYFCDNILFSDSEVSGVIDFYYACHGFLAYDLAIAANALAIKSAAGDRERVDALIAGYERVRKLTVGESKAFSGLLRLAALRFWVSRLYDAINPRSGAMVQIKDPGEYQTKLLFCRQLK